MTEPKPVLPSDRPRRRGSRWHAASHSAFAIVGLALLSAAARGEQGPPNPADRTAVRVQVEDVLPYPAAEVRAALLDLDAFPIWFPALEEWRIIARRDASADVYGRQRLPWPFRDRDYVVRYRWTDDGERFELEALGLPDASPDAPAGVVRVERLRSEWQVSPARRGARVRYAYEGDHDLPLPRTFLTRMWERHGDRVVRALAGEVERRRAERNSSARCPHRTTRVCSR